MFYPTEYLIEPFVDRLQNAYWRMYRHVEPDYAGLIAWVGPNQGPPSTAMRARRSMPGAIEKIKRHFLYTREHASKGFS